MLFNRFPYANWTFNATREYVPLSESYNRTDYLLKVHIDDAKWIDIGGNICEIEIRVKIGSEPIDGVMRLECNDVQNFSTDSKFMVKLDVKKHISLADLVPNINDSEWGSVRGIAVVVSFERQAWHKFSLI